MRVIRPWLVIGNWRSSQAASVLKQFNIGAVLQLAGPVKHTDITCLHVPVEDGEPVDSAKLARGIDFIREQKAKGHVVLSACGAGISRSTTFAIGALMAEEHITWDAAYRSILAEHPDAFPNPYLVHSLLHYKNENPPPVIELWKTVANIQRDVTGQ